MEAPLKPIALDVDTCRKPARLINLLHNTCTRSLIIGLYEERYFFSTADERNKAENACIESNIKCSKAVIK